jgi:predicted phosphodiesterase
MDSIICVGDIYGAGYGTANCCALLKARRIRSVRGNHDRWFVAAAKEDSELRSLVGEAAFEFLAFLPSSFTIETASGLTLVCHGVGNNDLAHVPKTFPNSFVRRALHIGLIPPRCSLVVHGHSHWQQQRTFEGVTFVTVGALSPENVAGCLMIDTQTGVVSPVVY